MTLFGSYWQSKKTKWWAAREAEFKAAYAEQEATLRRTLKAQEQDLIEAVQRQERLKLELAKASEELRTQLRLIEAKGSPSDIWAQAFSLGFSKAWEMMLPLMREGFSKSYETIFQEAVEHTLAGLEATIQKRIEEAQQTHLRPVNDLLAKRDEFRAKAQSSADSNAKLKFQNYVTAIEWALQGTNGHGH